MRINLLRVDSAVDVLSGKLKDILAQKEKGVIQVDSDCIVVEVAKKNATIKLEL